MDKVAQQRREEREFQLRIMQMMGQSVYGMPPPSMHVDPPSSASFALNFGTMHESTLARRMLHSHLKLIVTMRSKHFHVNLFV